MTEKIPTLQEKMARQIVLLGDESYTKRISQELDISLHLVHRTGTHLMQRGWVTKNIIKLDGIKQIFWTIRPNKIKYIIEKLKEGFGEDDLAVSRFRGL